MILDATNVEDIQEKKFSAAVCTLNSFVNVWLTQTFTNQARELERT